MVDLAHAFAAPTSTDHSWQAPGRFAPRRPQTVGAASQGRALSPSVRRAQPADFPALRRLINSAYAVERFFVDGERIETAELGGLAERGHFLVLDASTPQSIGASREIAAAIHVRIDDDGQSGAIGLLSVAPAWQGQGLGRRLVAVAEALCTALGCASVQLQIVNLRQELGPWYRSQGYRDVGTAPYDHRPATQPCHFIRMRKSL